MSDVGLDADLSLDIRQALEQVRRIERALDGATTGVTVRVTADASDVTGEVTAAVDEADTVATVTGEAAGLTGDVTAAIDAADTTATVTGDASELTGDITGAVDAADTSVLVDGDASDLTGEVTSAVDAGDSTVIVTGDASSITGAINGAVDAADTDVDVSVDPGGLSDAAAASDALNASLIASSQSGLNLRAVLATGFAAAAAAGFVQLIGAASDLEQAVGGTTAIFGEAEDTVVRFAEGAAEAAGLSEEAARRLTSQIGGLLQGFGFTQDEAAETSVVLAQLGADLAATFGGNPEEAVQALGAALRGEFDPLERFGVSLNVTQANLRAVELGLADSTSNVDLNARAQASLSLIMERSAQAQGQFGREVNTTAGQLERARAELTNTAAAIGATMQPAVNELLSSVRADLIPSLEDLGTTLGPSLVRLVEALLPAFGTFTSLLIALEPVVSALATVIDSIPGPVIAMIGTFLAFRSTVGPIGSLLDGLVSKFGGLIVPAGSISGAMNAAGGATQTFAQRAGGAVAAINPLTAVLAAAAIGFTLYAQAQAKAKAEAQAQEQQAKALGEAMRGTEGAVVGLTDALDDMVQAGKQIETDLGQFFDVDLSEALQETGLSVEQFTALVEEGGDAYQEFGSKLGDDKDTQVAVGTLGELEQQLNDVAEAQIAAGVITEDWTQAQADAALAQTEAADGSNAYVAALDVLTTAQAEEEEATEAATEALNDQQQAVADLVAETPAIGLYMAALSDGSSRNVTNLSGLAVAMADAGVTGDDLAAVLTELGSDASPQAQAALEAIGATITGLRDEALGTLPTLQDIAGAADEFSLSSFRDELRASYDAIIGFNDNLLLIAEQGGPRLAAAAAQLGPEFAAGIAEGIRSGNPEVVAEAETLLAGIEQAGTDTSTLITGTIGPNLATATGEMGAGATAAFGENFTLNADGSITAVEDQLTNRRPGVATRSAEMGAAGTTAFGASFKPSPFQAVSAAIFGIESGTTGAETAGGNVGSAGAGGFESNFTPDPRPAITQARTLVEAGASLSRKAGMLLGNEAAQGYRRGIEVMGYEGARAAGQAVAAVSTVRGAAFSAGYGVGSSLGQGIASGIASWTSQIANRAVNAVNQAAASARRAAQIASPSKVFAEIGAQMGEGMAVGLTDAAGAVGAAAADLAAAAVTPVESAAVSVDLGLARVDPAVFAGLAGPGAAPQITVRVEAGAVVIQGTDAPQADIAAAAGQLGTVLSRRLKFAAVTGG